MCNAIGIGHRVFDTPQHHSGGPCAKGHAHADSTHGVAGNVDHSDAECVSPCSACNKGRGSRHELETLGFADCVINHSLRRTQSDGRGDQFDFARRPE